MVFMDFKAKKKHNMHPKKAFPFFLYLMGTSIVFMVAGITLMCLWDLLYEYIISSNLVLRPNSLAYDVWVRNPIPLSLKVFMFNWTNSEDITKNDTKLKFQQLGPYYFSETKEKSSIVWNENDTVTFKHLRKWYFDASSSNGSLEDTVVSIDPVALSAVYTMRDWSIFMKKGFAITFLTLVDGLWGKHSVGQVLFEGYQDRLLQAASKLSFINSWLPPFKKFGWFYGRNGSEDYEGTFNMDTGVKGRLGRLYNWKYSSTSPYYRGSCGELENTSAGEFFSRNLRKDSIIKFFSSDLCRYVELEFEKEVEMNGILGFKFSASDKFLDSGTRVPENECFCDGDDCMPYGVLNVSACRYGSPAFVSLPHFYKADPYYLKNIEGLSPNKEQGEFFIIFEPTTGIPMQVAARLQLNLGVQSINGFTLYENLPRVYFPVLWFEQVVTIPDNMAFNLKLLVNFKVICYAISIIAISIGVLIEICVWYKICSMNLFEKRKKKEERKEKANARENVPLKDNNAD